MRHYAFLKACYKRPRKKGQSARVTLTAAMHKLTVLRNRLLKNPDFRLVSSTPLLAPVQSREVTSRAKDDDGETVSRRVGYSLSQPVIVQTGDISAGARLGRECAELLNDGVALVQEGVQFLYTKAGETKVEMMAEATRDARSRAEQIANHGGRRLRQLRSARMGVIQINPLHSSDTSWEGNNDRSSPEKTITATVSATFDLN